MNLAVVVCAPMWPSPRTARTCASRAETPRILMELGFSQPLLARGTFHGGQAPAVKPSPRIALQP